MLPSGDSVVTMNQAKLKEHSPPKSAILTCFIYKLFWQ